MLKINIGKENIQVSKNLFEKYNSDLFQTTDDNITLDCDSTVFKIIIDFTQGKDCLLYTSPSPRDTR